MKSQIAMGVGLGVCLLWGCHQPPVPEMSRPFVMEDFSYPWTNTPPPSTRCELQWRGDALHFLFDVEDSDVVVSSDWKGESTVDNEDRVELFFARDEALAQYFCIEVDPLGRVHDYSARHHRQFDSKWRCDGSLTRGQRTPNGYRVEGSIPRTTFEVILGKPFKLGTPLRLGVFRAEFRSSERDHPGARVDNWISWVKPDAKQPDFHVPSAFREVTLR